ncbi:MAG: ABC transporter permease subunit [Desulfuromonadaceae bacterium]|nr:ABC transporter permease subunit [Desulfuromonadaceae bacterium]
MSFQFETKVMGETLPLLMSGVKLTVIITLSGLLIGFVLGAGFGLLKLSPRLWLKRLAGIYVETVRGTPLIVQVMFLYFGLPMATGLRIPPLAAGIIAIAINSGAYIAEIVRGAVQSIDRGQMEAGRSIGLTKGQTMLYVIWPQAFKRMIPPLGNQFIISLKDTSLLTVIGVAELTRGGQEIIAVNFRAFEVWLTVGLTYLVMTMSIAWALKHVEERLSGAAGR